MLNKMTGLPGLMLTVTDRNSAGESPASTLLMDMLTDGTSYFSDPQWTNSPGRFYRLRSP